jgi:hypothetical protein
MWYGMVVGERLVDWERRVENPSYLQHRTSLAPRHLDTSIRFALRLHVVLNPDASKCFTSEQSLLCGVVGRRHRVSRVCGKAHLSVTIPGAGATGEHHAFR